MSVRHDFAEVMKRNGFLMRHNNNRMPAIFLQLLVKLVATAADNPGFMLLITDIVVTGKIVYTNAVPPSFVMAGGSGKGNGYKDANERLRAGRAANTRALRTTQSCSTACRFSVLYFVFCCSSTRSSRLTFCFQTVSLEVVLDRTALALISAVVIFPS
ncbi:hypothetical protein QTP88_000370 [Uroleucon formosanum]